MLKKKGTLRRASAAFAVAVGILAITGPGANAGALGLPEILNGKADSQALRIDLQLPSTDSLNAALTELGLGAAAVLPNGLLGNHFTQVIALNHGEVLRSAKKTIADHASGFAAPLQGLLGGVEKVTSRCDSSSCSGVTGASSGVEIKVLDEVIPGGLGTIRVAHANSATRSLVDTRNISGLAEVNLTLANLLNMPALAPLKDALSTLTDTVNDTVLPAVNPVLEDVGDLVAGLVKDTPLEGAITIGGVNPIPDLSTVDLLDLQVLPAFANVSPFTPKAGPGKGVKGLLAESRAKVANLDILGNGDKAWAHLGAIGIETSAFANGVKGAAKGAADVEIVGADLGGLLGLNIPTDTLRDLTNGNAVKEVVKKLGLPEQDELLAAVDLIYNVAGIQIETFTKDVDIDPKGNFASATAGTIAITAEPMIPNPTAILASLGSGDIVPRLGKNDFVSTGLKLRVELPSAAAASSIGKVLPKEFTPPPRTGVGTPLIAGVVLIGAAAMVRRFALAK